MRSFIGMLLAFLLIFAASGWSGTNQPENIKAVGVDDSRGEAVCGNHNPDPGNVITDSPGTQVGMTYYDYQTNGSTGHRVAVHDCGIHFAWMRSIDTWTGNRWVYYNFMDPQGNLGWVDGVAVSTVQGAGYTNIDVDDAGKALVAFHNAANLFVTLAEDDQCGGGNFTLYDVPDTYAGYLGFYWPYLAYDNGGRVHFVSTENQTGGQAFGHTFTTDYNNWPDLQLCNNGEDIQTVSPIVVASMVDDKVAIVYTRPRATGQTDNDVCFHESQDGSTWNYSNYTNITNYTANDSVRAYTDVDAVYDMDGDLHIIWSACGYLVGPTNAALLMHWSQATGTTMIASGWWASTPGVWNRTISKMSIGVDADNNLFAVWSQFDANDVSAGGYSNGELYMSYSEDGGGTWSTPVNITNSPSPGCTAGNCDSDHWASMWEFVDEYLHILYINDKDAGGIPQGEGSETDNPVLYYAYPNPLYTAPQYCRIGMWPYNPPVRVRPGGSFRYIGALLNTTNDPQTVDVWLMLNVPGIGRYGPIERFNNVPLGPNDTLIVRNIRQRVPGIAPLGTYDYIAFCGDYPDDVVDSFSFQFEVYTMGGPGDATGWDVSRWFDVNESTPSDFVLNGNYPNPFNARTNIRFELPVDSDVKLEVYNMLGQRVEILVDGTMTAGYHTVVWNAADYSSGIYFYKLTAGDRVFSRRMTLTK